MFPVCCIVDCFARLGIVFLEYFEAFRPVRPGRMQDGPFRRRDDRDAEESAFLLDIDAPSIWTEVVRAADMVGIASPRGRIVRGSRNRKFRVQHRRLEVAVGTAHDLLVKLARLRKSDVSDRVDHAVLLVELHARTIEQHGERNAGRHDQHDECDQQVSQSVVLFTFHGSLLAAITSGG